MPGFKIVGLCIVLAVVYGILHDQITARVCVEYFTIGHPRIIASESPTVLGLVWGVVSTWWAGALIGLPLALAARARSWPRLAHLDLARPLLALLLAMAAFATLAGFVGHALAREGLVELMEPLASSVPAQKHPAFIAAGAAHLASYGIGFLGGAVLILYAVLRRRRLAKTPLSSGDTAQSADSPVRAGP